MTSIEELKMQTPGFHYGFYLGKYTDVYSMPDKTALEFLRQFKVSLWQKKTLTGKLVRCGNPYGTRHSHEGIDDLDYEVDYPEWKGCDDSKGDDFIQSIILQRHDMIRKYEEALVRVNEEEDRIAEQKRDQIRDDYEWAMTESKNRDTEREKEESARKQRKESANFQIRWDAKKRREKAEVAKRAAAVQAEWNENEKRWKELAKEKNINKSNSSKK